MADHYVGIDVGTGSARAGIFTANGTLVAAATRDIRIWKEEGSIVEQSSGNIWAAICAALQAAMRDGGVDPSDVRGIGFDATCSLVAVGPGGAALAVGPSGDANRDVIVWMDHRAADQAERINAGGHEVLNYVGGRISPEMQTPKLLWLKENNPATFAAAEHFFDLPDFLTWKATGSTSRSLCTLTCKWTYLGHESGFDPDYFHAIGLGALADEGFRRIGTQVLEIARPCGPGLSEQAARELGLSPGTTVGTALIDAHAGGVGTLGGRLPDGAVADALQQSAVVLGTSSCTMTPSREAVFVPGIWGPYFGAMLPDLWLLEGGQSAFGAALDHLALMHPAGPEAQARARNAGQSVAAFLEDHAIARHGTGEAAIAAAAHVHVLPEFLGNRAPDSDPAATAVLMGLGLDQSLHSLADLHVAGLCGVAYGMARIFEAQSEFGVRTNMLVASGGAAKSTFLRQILADATGHEVALPASEEPVLLGAAMLGAVASGRFADLSECAAAMAGYKGLQTPSRGETAALHRYKRKAYDDLRKTERRIRARFVDG